MNALNGQVAIVTGAGRGIGAAVAKELARGGADVVLCDICEAEAARSVIRAIEDAGRRVRFCRTSVADRAAVNAMMEDTMREFGRLDILVNNAAASVRKLLLELEPEDVARVWDVVLWGTFHCTQLAVRRMVEQGRSGNVVMISSVHAHRPFPLSTAYNGAKAAINQMAATWALELADQGIRVNVIEPGWIGTEGERLQFGEHYLAEQSQTLPMKRLGTPEEIGSAVRFLVSDNAAYITGACLRVDGAISLSR